MSKAEGDTVVRNSQLPDTYNFVYKDLTTDEKKEIDRLTGIAEDLLNTKIPDVLTLLSKLSEYINISKLEKVQNDDLAYELGSVYGKLIVDKYGWHWVYVTVNGEGSFCVRSPDKRFACKVHNYIYSLLNTDKTNNLKLLFNLLNNLGDQKIANELTFLN